VTLFDTEAPEDGVQRYAKISDDGLYRYALGRRWMPDGPVATFVMLNPSTADGTVDDPTIRRCIGFARSWDCAALHVLNLYAWRATDPQEVLLGLRGGVDVVGPANDRYLRSHIEAACTNGLPLIAAWGSHARPDRVDQVLAMPGAVAFQALGLTQSGAPRHPLYLPKSAERAPYPPRPSGEREESR
jgi:hypothetical protein